MSYVGSKSATCQMGLLACLVAWVVCGVLWVWVVLKVHGSVRAETRGIQSCGQQPLAVLFSTPAAAFGAVSCGSESVGLGFACLARLWCIVGLGRSQGAQLHSS